MQEFLHTNNDDIQEDIERYRKMINSEKEVYFDVHQIENIFEFYVEKELFDEAEKILNIGLRQHPNATSLQLKKASFLSDKGKFNEAGLILEKLTKIETSNPDVFLTLGWNYLRQSDAKKAVENFKIAISVAFDDEEDILFEIGFNLSQEGYFKEALPFLLESANKYKPNENILFELAFVHDRLGKLDKSIEYYNKLLDLNPYSENAWYNLGILYSKKEEYTKAAQAYEFTIAINPEHPEAHFNLGNSFAHASHFDKALDAYTEHISLSKDVTLTYQYIADCWEQLGNYDMAIRFYNIVSKKDKKNPDAWYGMGTAFMGKGDFINAMQTLDQAISIEPLNPDYWFAHARCLFELGKKEDAIKSLENGIDIDPDETAAWIELFKLKHSTEILFSPQDYIDILIDNYDSFASVHYLAAFVYLTVFKNENMAAHHLEKAININREGLDVLITEIPGLTSIQKLSSIIMSVKNNK
ncbi:MAG: tetratricopeptide repeat protein [Chlorobi bacterium]|nr:tetratricopeptide repeat protein [Chlorobiota bacterium]